LVLKLAQDSPEFRTTAVELLAADPQLSTAAVKFFEQTALDKSAGDARVKAAQALFRKSDNDAVQDAAFRVAAHARQGKANEQLTDAVREFARAPMHAQHIAAIIKQLASDDQASASFAYQLLLGVEANAKATAKARGEALTAIEAAFAKPESTVALLDAITHAQADSYGLRVAALRESDNESVRIAARATAKALDLDALPNENDPNRVTVDSQSYEDVFAAVQTIQGDAKLGSRLFVRQACVACHTVKQGETLKGPYLGGISARYKRHELAESVLKPSAKIAQGFEAQWFQTAQGLIVEGFVVRESGSEVELRTNTGAAAVIAKDDIEDRGKRDVSVMPDGLVNKLTAEEVAAILAYLESLKQ
jgi:putative heme-binding domain-containing protein